MGVLASANAVKPATGTAEKHKGSRDSCFPTWILTPVPTAALGEPFSASASLLLLGREKIQGLL